MESIKSIRLVKEKSMDIRDLEKEELEREENLIQQQVYKTNKKAKEKLNIVYLMIWTKVCGGSKIILEYANRLSELGHNITLITYDQKPEWFSLNSNIEFIQIPENEKIEDNIPSCDIIVATSWKCIFGAIKSGVAPVVYFEQGGAHIFDTKNLSPIKQQVVKNRIKAVPFIYTVSNYAKRIIKQEYQQDAYVIPNAIDNNIFYAENIRKDTDIIEITTIGPEEFEFKHVENIIQAIEILSQRYSNIRFNWISQTEPKVHKQMAIVNPPQSKIGDILRKTDIYICASDYESFCLPALEAMTCGASVVTTNNGGIEDFVQDGVNALIIEKNSVESIVEKVENLINNKETKKLLAKNGIETSKKFSWEQSVTKLEKYYKEVSVYEVIK